jgi:cyanophycinase-like exopeptidase
MKSYGGTMKTHYYLGWFNNYFPENLVRVLQEDITDRKSLVMISSNPLFYEDDGATERSWFDQAGILFDEVHLINYRVQKKDALIFIQNASVIFLLGGDTIKQNGFLKEYGLSDAIKKSRAVVMGASAGAINMSAKWLCSKSFGHNVEISSLYDGIGLDDFSVLSHFDLENNMTMVQEELSPLSEEMDIYASNKDCAVRVKNGEIDILGNVYLISHSQIHKLDETL